jgi:hypothetical protein
VINQRSLRSGGPGLACVLLLVLGAFVSSCGGGASAVPAPAAGTDPRLLPLGSPLPAISAQVGPADRSSSEAGQGGQIISFSGAEFLNAAGGTVDGDTLILQSSETEPAWAMYKAGGLAGLKITTFGVETIPGDLDSQYSVGLSNFSDGTWDYFINSVLPEVEIDLSQNTQRLVSHLGNLYWVVVVSGGKSVRVVAGHAFTAAETDGDWCPEQVTGLTASRGLSDHIHLEWNARDCARKYEVWGRRSPDQGPRGVSCWYIGHDTDWVKVGETTENSFDDYDVEPGIWLDYKVRARNHCGRGGFSDIASGYMGDECDAEGVISAVDEMSLTLEDGHAYALSAETMWLLEDGGAGDRSSFAVGDRVAVDGEAGENGCVALTVQLQERGGEEQFFDAESVIDVRADGMLNLQNGMRFTYDEATDWLDAEGNVASIELFQPLVPVHVWGSVKGMGQAKALKVQLLPGDPAM